MRVGLNSIARPQMKIGSIAQPAVSAAAAFVISACSITTVPPALAAQRVIGEVQTSGLVFKVSFQPSRPLNPLPINKCVPTEIAQRWTVVTSFEPSAHKQMCAY